MFSNNLVVAVKVNGKVLREFDGTVALPFGSEYTILLKNLATTRASVNIFIDGQAATEDVSLIIDPGESLELKRFVKNGNLDAGNAFKFIEKTSQIESYRGNNAEDGLLTVSYEFEQYKKATYNSVTYQPMFMDKPYKSLTRNSISGSSNVSYLSNVDNSVHIEGMAQCSLQNNSGITAPGSIVEQSFVPVAKFIGSGTIHSLTIKMVGATKSGEKVKSPIAVKKLQKCSMCGTNTKQTAKFCHNCGASVQIV